MSIRLNSSCDVCVIHLPLKKENITVAAALAAETGLMSCLLAAEAEAYISPIIH